MDAVLIDEATTVLNGINATRLRSWLKRDKIPYRMAMSATPFARGYQTAWSLYALIAEDGAPLGFKSQTEFMRATHDDIAPRHLDFPIWRIKPAAEKIIGRRASEFSLRMEPDF